MSKKEANLPLKPCLIEALSSGFVRIIRFKSLVLLLITSPVSLWVKLIIVFLPKRLLPSFTSTLKPAFSRFLILRSFALDNRQKKPVLQLIPLTLALKTLSVRISMLEAGEFLFSVIIS